MDGGRGTGRRRRWAAASTALVALAGPGGAAAASRPLTPAGFSETSCFDPTKPNADFEAYGPTDVNAQAGNGRVTVGENDAGTVTVLKHPNPSFYNQVKYLAVDRDAAGRARAQFPNEGILTGLRWRTHGGSGFAWLRDWAHSQAYASDDLPVPVTRYRSPRALGLTVTVADVTPPGTSALVREVWVKRAHRSSVRSATIVAFANFNAVAHRTTYFPLDDWCYTQLSDGHTAYDQAGHALVSDWSGTDQASGKPASAAVALGLDAADTEHQAGRDGYDPAAEPSGPADGYDEATVRLGGSDSATGQTTSAIAAPLRFDRRGRAAMRTLVGAGTTPAGAVAAVQRERARRFGAEMAAESGDWRRWLRPTVLPRTTDRRVTQVAKRTLISVRLAIVPETGAIVASADTQGPYGEDWVRDGAFIDQVLDRNGLHADVTRHARFYARIQTSLQNPSPIRPPGNWAMAYYGDGIDGAPIPWEIDETGLGIWLMWDHARFLGGNERTQYLRDVYPAISRAADFLAECADPTNGMQCPANEDDNFSPSQTLRGAETTFLALTDAIAAASATGDRGAHVATWRTRLAALAAAIERLYDPATKSYREGNSTANAYAAIYEDGAWLLWPVGFKPYSDATMRSEAVAVRRALATSLGSSAGEYEAKALLALGHIWRTPAHRRDLRRVLGYMARRLTTPTGLFGEAWRRFNGRPRPLEDMPHVWEHSLFYLAGLEIDGARRYRFASGDAIGAACRRGQAPTVAC